MGAALTFDIKSKRPASLPALIISVGDYFSAFSGFSALSVLATGSGFRLSMTAAMIFFASSGFSISAFFAASLPWLSGAKSPHDKVCVEFRGIDSSWSSRNRNGSGTISTSTS